MVTIALYTDAGITQHSLAHIATWATVALIPGQDPIEASGRLRATTNCTATAELRAIANAVHKLVMRGLAGPGDEIHVRTDSLAAVERIMRRQVKRPESTMAKATRVIHALAEQHRLTIRATWIPGHKPDDFSPHARWNNRCDLLCREVRTRPVPTKARRSLDVARRLAGRP